VAALEALRILDGGVMPPPGPDREHLLIEVVKQAMADRDAWVTDPDEMPEPPATLLSDHWIQSRRDRLDLTKAASPDAGPPKPGDTAYLCAADADGLMVSLIQSNFLHFGSGVHVPEWGINLNNRGFSFAFDDRPNRFGPGKRPMHTLIPAMALRDGTPHLVFGSMGGDAQVAVHVQVLAHIVDDGEDPSDALAEPRWRVDQGAWRVRAEDRFPSETLSGLRERGHDVREIPGLDSGMGHAHAIWPATEGYGASYDPRCEGAALGI
jgi:gamma-glutamyltranspeptidase/glutathione hydrolase